MTDGKRRCLAFIAVCIVRSSLHYRNVYDHVNKRYSFFAVTRRSDNDIMVFDYDRRNYMGGELPNIYDYHSSSFVQLAINGTEIRVFDYEHGYHLNGNVSGKSINIYDYETGRYYSYYIS